MKLDYKWKKQLLICVAIFLVMLLVGYFFKIGLLVVLGIILVCISAVIAERGLRCPSCKTSLFKEAMERGAKEITCEKCGEKISLE